MPKPTVFPLNLNEVKDTWITQDTYGPLCAESRLHGGQVAELLEGLRVARQHIRSLVAELDRVSS